MRKIHANFETKHTGTEVIEGINSKTGSGFVSLGLKAAFIVGRCPFFLKYSNSKPN